jgi:hypothetical protein
MVRIFRAIKSFNADLKANPATFRKLFGIYFAFSLVVFIITTLVDNFFNAVIFGTAVFGYINLILMFVLFHAFFGESKSFIMSAKVINPRILLKLFVILIICEITVELWNVFEIVYGININPAIFNSPIVQLLSSFVEMILLVYEYCLLIFAAENPHETIGTTLFGGISLMRKLLFPIFILLIGMALLTLALTAVFIAPFIPLGGGSIDFENISSVIVNIISIGLTFLYTGIFVKLRTDT